MRTFFLSEIRDAFDACDHDGDGTVDAGELKRVMRACGQNASTSQIQDIINDVDHNGINHRLKTLYIFSELKNIPLTDNRGTALLQGELTFM